ncbi:hypothetical protein EW146_g3440 [Bondarzewia mesenterica]|uniref:Transcription activator GCR1-like domain-containing protein n=1 Tax=Bondarzewia mesenterica TaxID=1095465 RepID=A0A4S4LZ05_9AGAM|nr:hypothetical protein EW146_g3440 [Bondarzewia mesenterica]
MFCSSRMTPERADLVHPPPYPPSPLARKKMRLSADEAVATSIAPTDLIEAFDDAHKGIAVVHDTQVGHLASSPLSNAWQFDQQMTPSASVSVAARGSTEITFEPSMSSSMQREALEALDQSSHAYRMGLVARNQADSETGETYARQLRRYEQWWIVFQSSQLTAGLTHAMIPVLPITAAKVTKFLDIFIHADFAQVKPGSKETIPGTQVGYAQIASVISALEHWRSNHQHLYRDDPDVQRPLRSDIRIKMIEKSSRQSELKQIETSQALKATGTSSDMRSYNSYTSEELQRCSMWCFKEFSGIHCIFVDMRDRAMLLTSAAMVFRGDSARIVQWSDLFLSRLVLHDVSVGYEVPVLGILADNAKHNKEGRVDEFGMIQHRIVEICPIGAVAFYLFTYFHVLSSAAPNFTPDFSNTNYGLYGRREWYEYYLFHASDIRREMSYENHRQQINNIHLKNNISLTKATHATRNYGAQNTRANGASVDGTKAMGGWSDQGSYRHCYDRSFPTDALLASAMFNARQPSSYSLPRDVLEPPAELMAAVFPWVEREQNALNSRSNIVTTAGQPDVGHCKNATDLALQQFLRVLIWFRRVLLQDAAIIISRHGPDFSIFHFPPFNTPAFRSFAADSSQTITNAESAAEQAFRNVPAELAKGVRWVSKATSPVQPANMPGPLPAPVDLHNIQLQLLSAAASTPAFTELSGSGGGGSSSNQPIVSPALPLLPSNSLTPDAVDLRALKWNSLVAKYGEDRMRLHHCSWINGEWLPLYKYQAVMQISDIWTEWTIGLNGYLPVRDLDEGWGARWRRNNAGQKTEAGRQKKVVSLVTELSQKRNWTVTLALRFIQTKYEPQFRARAFCEYIQQKGGIGYRAVVVASMSFP